MSRIGRLPITVPAGVTVTVDSENLVTVKGPKGTLTQQVNPAITVNQEGNIITLTRPTDAAPHRAMHGLYRTLVNNMVVQHGLPLLLGQCGHGGDLLAVGGVDPDSFVGQLQGKACVGAERQLYAAHGILPEMFFSS